VLLFCQHRGSLNKQSNQVCCPAQIAAISLLKQAGQMPYSYLYWPGIVESAQAIELP
jgi:hypothetical protein